MNEWDNEPDELEWDHAGFKCKIIRCYGRLNGYVGLAKDHPLHGIDESEESDKL